MANRLDDIDLDNVHHTKYIEIIKELRDEYYLNCLMENDAYKLFKNSNKDGIFDRAERHLGLRLVDFANRGEQELSDLLSLAKYLYLVEYDFPLLRILSKPSQSTITIYSEKADYDYEEELPKIAGKIKARASDGYTDQSDACYYKILCDWMYLRSELVNMIVDAWFTLNQKAGSERRTEREKFMQQFSKKELETIKKVLLEDNEDKKTPLREKARNFVNLVSADEEYSSLSEIVQSYVAKVDRIIRDDQTLEEDEVYQQSRKNLEEMIQELDQVVVDSEACAQLIAELQAAYESILAECPTDEIILHRIVSDLHDSISAIRDKIDIETIQKSEYKAGVIDIFYSIFNRYYVRRAFSDAISESSEHIRTSQDIQKFFSEYADGAIRFNTLEKMKKLLAGRSRKATFEEFYVLEKIISLIRVGVNVDVTEADLRFALKHLKTVMGWWLPDKFDDEYVNVIAAVTVMQELSYLYHTKLKYTYQYNKHDDAKTYSAIIAKPDGSDDMVKAVMANRLNERFLANIGSPDSHRVNEIKVIIHDIVEALMLYPNMEDAEIASGFLYQCVERLIQSVSEIPDSVEMTTNAKCCEMSKLKELGLGRFVTE